MRRHNDELLERDRLLGDCKGLPRHKHPRASRDTPSRFLGVVYPVSLFGDVLEFLLKP